MKEYLNGRDTNFSFTKKVLLCIFLHGIIYIYTTIGSDISIQ